MDEIKNKVQIVSRIAPTSSGYLHIGNIINFVLTWTFTRKDNGHLALRIDDLDQYRSRVEFIENIFFILDFLKIQYDSGPCGVDDFQANHSQALKQERYLKAMESIAQKYNCDCTRKKISQTSDSPIYPQICREKGLLFSQGQTQVRYKLTQETKVRFSKDRTSHQLNEDFKNFLCQNEEILLSKKLGDFVIWGKDNLANYQLVSTVDDIDLGTNLFVRGQDLMNSSAAQIQLSQDLKDNHLAESEFIHHKLVQNRQNEKLSKSNQSHSVQNLIDKGCSRHEIFTICANEMGLDHPEKYREIEDFLYLFAD